MEEMAKRTGAKHIPEDIIFDHILLKLQVKPLLRFMLVKKSWHARIKSPLFVRRHFDKSVSCNKNDDSQDYLLHTYFWSKNQTNCGQLFHDGPNGYTKILDIKLPKFVDNHGEECFIVVGSVNGLICLSEDCDTRYGRRIYFWNPLIKKLRENVDSTCDDVFDRSSWVGLGFWFDSDENDHKLVRVIYYDVKEDTADFPEFNCCHAEIYSFSRNSWRKIGSREVNPLISNLTGGVLVNGKLYWLAISGDEDGTWPVILCFNLKNERFVTIDFPLLDEITPDLFMGYMGSLAAFFNLGRGNRTLWVLREHGDGRSSWKKEFNLAIQESIYCSLGITKDNCFSFLTKRRRMVEYDLLDGNVKSIGIAEYGNHNGMTRFRESLLLLDEETHDSAESNGHIDVAVENEFKKEEIEDPKEQAAINTTL